MGDYTFWDGRDRDRRVPVVLLGEQASRQGETQTVVNRGDPLAVLGTIRAIREVRLLDEGWVMDDLEWERMERSIIYINAIRVEDPARVRRPERPRDQDG